MEQWNATRLLFQSLQIQRSCIFIQLHTSKVSHDLGRFVYRFLVSMVSLSLIYSIRLPQRLQGTIAPAPWREHRPQSAASEHRKTIKTANGKQFSICRSSNGPTCGCCVALKCFEMRYYMILWVCIISLSRFHKTIGSWISCDPHQTTKFRHLGILGRSLCARKRVVFFIFPQAIVHSALSSCRVQVYINWEHQLHLLPRSVSLNSPD